MITTFLVLGAGAAMQAAQAGELPDSIQEFAAEQQQIILLQGQMAHEQIRREVRKDLESERVAFIESQMRDIEAQGAVALAEIQQDLDLIRLEAELARLPQRPVPRIQAKAPEMVNVKNYDR
jgi:hypothetical protein